jgi:hypothetical protein
MKGFKISHIKYLYEEYMDKADFVKRKAALS